MLFTQCYVHFRSSECYQIHQRLWLSLISTLSKQVSGFNKTNVIVLDRKFIRFFINYHTYIFMSIILKNHLFVYFLQFRNTKMLQYDVHALSTNNLFRFPSFQTER